MKIAIEIGVRAGEGGAYGNLGNAYFSLGDFRKAIEYHEKHLKIAIEIGDQERRRTSLWKSRSVLTFHWVTSEKPLSIIEKHLKIAIEIGDRAGEGRAYGNLGNAYFSLGDFRKAIEYHEKDLKNCKRNR